MAFSCHAIHDGATAVVNRVNAIADNVIEVTHTKQRGAFLTLCVSAIMDVEKPLSLLL